VTQIFFAQVQLVAFRWVGCLHKQFEPIQLIAQHAFNGWRDLLESSVDEPADTVGELNTRIFGSGQFPRHASGKTRRLERTERAGEPHELRRSDVNDSEMFDSAAVRQLLAKASACARVYREILRVV
jgi:hypothetical protein